MGKLFVNYWLLFILKNIIYIKLLYFLFLFIKFIAIYLVKYRIISEVFKDLSKITINFIYICYISFHNIFIYPNTIMDQISNIERNENIVKI